MMTYLRIVDVLMIKAILEGILPAFSENIHYPITSPAQKPGQTHLSFVFPFK